MGGRGRSGSSSALNHCVHCGLHAGWCLAVGPVPWGNCASPSPPSQKEGVALLVARTCNEVVPAHEGVFTRETDPRTSDLYSLLGACMYRTRYQVCCTWNERLETGVRTTSTRIVYQVILLLLLYVYCSRAHPRFPSKLRRRRLQDSFYLYRKLTKILVGRQFSFLCGRQVHF